MTIASTFEPFDREKVFCNMATWEMMFGERLNDNPDLADSMAWLFFELIRELEKGKKGHRRVINTLKLGVEFVYAYTEICRLSYQAYLSEMEGRLAPEDVLRQILNGVIERAKGKGEQPAGAGD